MSEDRTNSTPLSQWILIGITVLTFFVAIWQYFQNERLNSENQAFQSELEMMRSDASAYHFDITAGNLNITASGASFSIPTSVVVTPIFVKDTGRTFFGRELEIPIAFGRVDQGAQEITFSNVTEALCGLDANRDSCETHTLNQVEVSIVVHGVLTKELVPISSS